MQPKVSILIPLYNSEKHIAETINSVINQSYDNIELIIVDDGSKDKSHDIAQTFVSENVKVIQQTNQGACAARNNAFKASIGDYIVFFDADDIMGKNKIKHQVEAALKYGDENIYSSQWITFTNTIPSTLPLPGPLDKDFDDISSWCITSWKGNCSAQTGIWLTPRKIVELTGPWNEKLSVNQDGEYFFRAMMNAQSVKYVKDAPTYYRREVESSISSTSEQNPNRAKSILNSYKTYEAILSKQDDQEIRIALAQNYINFIYLFHPQHPELIELAWQYIDNLNVNEKWVVGGKNFQRLCKLVGFKRALSMRNKLNI